MSTRLALQGVGVFDLRVGDVDAFGLEHDEHEVDSAGVAVVQREL